MMKPIVVTMIFLFTCAVFAASGAGAAEKSTLALPSRVANHERPFFPAVIAQVGEACSNASSIGYVFTYELNAARNVSSADSANMYPYFNTYNFLNEGSESKGTHTMFVDAWKFARDNGIMNAIDFGPVEPRSTRWVNGYDHYLHGMGNRIESIDSMSFFDDGAFPYFKRLLFDHGNGSSYGGIFIITVCALGVQGIQITDKYESGKWIVHSLGTDKVTGHHTLTVTGYDDSINYDYNYDGAITSDIDINNDDKVDMADNEHGAFICANTWGESSGDNGFIYVPFRLMATPFEYGGLLTNKGYFATVKKEYHPEKTFKIALSHNQRSALSLSVGIAADSAARTPEHIRLVNQFNHAGGPLPMRGLEDSSSIEIGLDVSDLSDSIGNSSGTAYFLVIDSDDSSGACTALSLVDYTTATATEFVSQDAPAKIVAGRNIFRIAAPSNKIIAHAKNITRQTAIAVRPVKSGFALFLPSGMHHIALFSINGRSLFSEMVRGNESWYTVPVSVPRGACIVRVSGNNTTKSFSTITMGQ